MSLGRYRRVESSAPKCRSGVGADPAFRAALGQDFGVRERTPAEGIRLHSERLKALTDAEFIEKLRSTEPLPQGGDDDPAWEDDRVWDRAEFVIAAADELGERRLVEAIAPLFALAALGDTYEMMPGIRHGPEAAVRPDWHRLTPIMLELVHHSRPGCRRWAVRELGLLRDPMAVPSLLNLCDDPEAEVRYEVCTSLSMIGPKADDVQRVTIQRRLAELSESDPSDLVRHAAAGAL
jgi:hypothetical protein